MSDSRRQSERFLTDIIRTLHEDIGDDRAEYFRSELKVCQSDDPATSWKNWCDYNGYDYSIGHALSRYGNICDILETLLAEQKRLDRAVAEEYFEEQQAYRELQGC